MIATDHLVFLHLHKSGGTFVNQWLLESFPDARRLGYHLPRTEIPQPYRDLPVVGIVRNPWSYYVSWYSFQANKRRANPLFQVMTDDGRNDFNATVRNLMRLGSDAELLDRLIGLLPKDYINRGLNLPGFQAEKLRGTGLGFYSWLYRYMYAGEPPARIVRLEEMRTALPALIEELGEPVSAEARRSIASTPPARPSDHRPYPDYYDDSLRDLVAERDCAIIDAFDYQFGG